MKRVFIMKESDVQKYFLGIFLGVFFVLLLMGFVSATNLLSNGNAELGNTNGWSTRWGSSFSVSSVDPRSGTYSFLKEGYEQIESDFISIDIATEYKQEGWFKSSGSGATVHYGFIPYDNNKKEIARQYVYYYPGSETELYADIKASDKIIKIKDGSKWQVFNYGVVAFNVDTSGNYADLPNFNLSNHNIVRVENKGDYWEVEFATNVGKDALAGTKIREHRFGGTYMYNSANGLSVPSSWTKYSSVIKGECTSGVCDGENKWWKGTKYVKVLIIANYGQNTDYKLFFDDLVFDDGSVSGGTTAASCVHLVDAITALLNANNGQLKCGDKNYNKTLDIDKDKFIVSQDSLLVINKNNEGNYVYCEDKLKDVTDPCATATCTDSDGGKNYYVRGETKACASGGGCVSSADTCKSLNELQEVYCPDESPDKIEVEKYNCPYGCSADVCVSGSEEDDNGDSDEECIPEYVCEITPLICPSNGMQTKICEDINCGQESYQEEIICSPGECSGCTLENKCLPYGYRTNLEGENVYCEVNGNFELQRTVDAEGNWATCQNNYECESNICSSGECIEVAAAIKQSKGLRTFLIRLVCRLGNLFNSEDYDACIADYLG